MPAWLAGSAAPDLTGTLASALPLLLVGLVPLALVTLTSFAKVLVAFSALRNALGAPDVPSSAVVTSLAFALSVFVMAPVATRVEARLASPAGGSPSALAVLEAGKAELATFLYDNSGASERALFGELAAERKSPLGERDLALLWPAFVLSELKQAFTIGFTVAVPFLVLDLIVAHALLALGLSSLPLAAAAFPLKLLLFVSVDGFQLLSRALVLSYR
jgi:type III secretion protein R